MDRELADKQVKDLMEYLGNKKFYNEKSIEDASNDYIAKVAKELGVPCEITKVVGRGEAGVPDTDIVVAGLPIKIEYKKDNRNATPKQLYKLKRYNDAGAMCLVINKVNMERHLLAIIAVITTAAERMKQHNKESKDETKDAQ